ncbi:MAG TPA: type II toxin-antitoxin system VapC family toxin [Gemmataceae bacterium]|nr:type II toxin-antitoxin system VapC family toxin [Gemmataceae bacterium]
MTTMVADPVFVDTNILVYARATMAPLHGNAVTKLQDLATAGHPLWISRQILREYLSAMSRPGTWTTPVSMTGLVSDVQTFERQLFLVEDGAAITTRLLTLLTAIPCAGKQIHDANIVATMLTQGIQNLLTHNVADFNRFAAHITVIPLI